MANMAIKTSVYQDCIQNINDRLSIWLRHAVEYQDTPGYFTSYTSMKRDKRHVISEGADHPSTRSAGQEAHGQGRLTVLQQGPNTVALISEDRSNQSLTQVCWHSPYILLLYASKDWTMWILQTHQSRQLTITSLDLKSSSLFLTIQEQVIS